jgi:hypothetical protein
MIPELVVSVAPIRSGVNVSTESASNCAVSRSFGNSTR